MYWKKVEFKNLAHTVNGCLDSKMGYLTNDEVEKIIKASYEWDNLVLKAGDTIEATIITFKYHSDDEFGEYLIPDFSKTLFKVIEDFDNDDYITVMDSCGTETEVWKHNFSVRKLSESEILKGLILGAYKRNQYNQLEYADE